MKSKKISLSFKTETTVLRKALAHVKGVVERRNTIPILAHVAIEVRGGVLTLTGTDLEARISEIVPGHAGNDGACTADAHQLHAVLHKMPDGQMVEISHVGGDGGLSVRCEAFEATLLALPIEDFPNSFGVDLPIKFNIPAESLRALLDRVAFAISTEETRYYLNGIYLHPFADMLRAVATDGHRLAIMDQPLPDGAAGMKGIIVPRKAIAELRKLLAKYSGDVGIATGGDNKFHIEFSIPGITLLSKVIDGTFPDYTRVVPTNNTRVMRVGNKTLGEALARVASITAKRAKPVRMSLSKDALTLSVSSPEQGTAVERINGGAVTYDGESFDIGFNGRYLRDILGVIGPDVSVALNDQHTPTIFRGSDDTFTSILMPYRI